MKNFYWAETSMHVNEPGEDDVIGRYRRTGDDQQPYLCLHNFFNNWLILLAFLLKDNNTGRKVKKYERQKTWITKISSQIQNVRTEF